VMTNKEAAGAVPNPKQWVVVVSQPTCNVLKNRGELSNICHIFHPVSSTLRADILVSLIGEMLEVSKCGLMIGVLLISFP